MAKDEQLRGITDEELLRDFGITFRPSRNLDEAEADRTERAECRAELLRRLGERESATKLLQRWRMRLSSNYGPTDRLIGVQECVDELAAILEGK